jgi:hypothetical protein
MRIHHWFSIFTLAILFSTSALVVPSLAEDDVPSVETSGEEEEAAKLMDENEALDWGLPVALFLAATHFFAPTLRRFIQANEARVSSLGGGMAASYVFVHLMAELDEGHELVGSRIHLFVLFGFIVYYGIEYFLQNSSSDEKSGESKRLEFSIQMAIGWVYTWLIMYSMPETIQQTGFRIIPPLLALALHLIYTDFHLGEEFTKLFDRWGRMILASAAIVGWAGDLVYFQNDPAVSDLLSAMLAGAVIYKLFKYELPDHQKSSFAWFLTGVLVFLVLEFSAK